MRRVSGRRDPQARLDFHALPYPNGINGEWYRDTIDIDESTMEIYKTGRLYGHILR